MKTYYLIVILLLATLYHSNVYSQTADELDDLLTGPQKSEKKEEKPQSDNDLRNDIIRVNYSKKNAKLAMLMSALVPGAGQYYAEPSTITAFVYPIVELALIGGILYFDKQGDNKTKEYKTYVTEVTTIQLNDTHSYTGPRYRRDFQSAVANILIGIHDRDIYDEALLHLDATNTSKFYEDIAKYDRYAFGWVDWYAANAEFPPPEGAPLNPEPSFIFTFMSPPLPANDSRINSLDNTWIGNVPVIVDTVYSSSNELRSTYRQMRNDAEKQYKTAHSIGFGIVLNHIVSAVHAVVLTNKVNRLYLSDNVVRFNYFATLRNGNVTPMLALNYNF